MFYFITGQKEVHSRAGKMKKQQLLNKLDQAWVSFKESYSGMSEAEMMKPGIMGEWSVRDILAHVTVWEEEALKYLPYALEGRRPPRYKDLYGGIDDFNAQMTEKKRVALIHALTESMAPAAKAFSLPVMTTSFTSPFSTC